MERERIRNILVIVLIFIVERSLFKRWEEVGYDIVFVFDIKLVFKLN